MAMKLSNGMERLISDVKKESIGLLSNSKDTGIIKIKKKPTKNKIFEFHLINLGKPVIKLFINNKFYATYFYNRGKWTEER